MNLGTPTIVTGVGAFFLVAIAALSPDPAFSTHMGLMAAILAVATIFMLRRISFWTVQAAPITEGDEPFYMDEVIRYGVIATALWGVIGFLVGVVAASQ